MQLGESVPSSDLTGPFATQVVGEGLETGVPVEVQVVPTQWLADLQRSLEEHKASLALSEQRFQHFQESVREMAIEKAKKLKWCDEGLNEALRELGLEPKTRKYRVEIRVFAFQDIEIEVDAENMEEADTKAHMMLDDNPETWDSQVDQDSWQSDSMVVSEPETREVVEI